MIHKPQSYLNCINVKLWLKTCFPIDFEFLIFLFFFPFLFSPYLFSLGHIYSYNHIYMHIYRPKQAESRVGITREEQSTGTCMKGGGPCYSSWMSAIGSHSPALLCTHHSQFAMTIEATLASGTGVQVLCHLQIEVLSVPQLEDRYNDKIWRSYVRPEVSITSGRCNKKEVGLHHCGVTWTIIIRMRD